MSAESFLNGRVTLHGGDSLDILRTLPDASIDSCVCDPPYALVSIGKRFGKAGAAPPIVPEGRSGAYARASAGFMGKSWDTGERAFAVDFWAEVYRVLKPGGHVLAFGGTRTYHRLACAIEDAGFDIRDQVGWCFGSGFPKSHDPKKAAGAAVCRCAACDDSVRGMRGGSNGASGVAKTSHDTDLLATVQRRSSRTGMGGTRAQGLGSTQDGGCVGRAEQPGLEGRGDVSPETRELRLRALREVPGTSDEHGAIGRLCDGAPAGDGRVGTSAAAASGMRASLGPRAAEQSEIELGALAGQSEPQARGAWEDCTRCGKPMVPDGLGSALKPGWEPICLARKPLDGTLAANVLAHGTGALNIGGCRVEGNDAQAGRTRHGGGVVGNGSSYELPDSRGEMPAGRWPANVLLDGSDEVAGAFPAAPGQQRSVGPEHGAKSSVNVFGDYGARDHFAARGDSGSAARFFYNAKADSDDRIGSKHPTVKPVDLMRWCCRLVTPPGGIVLDPFAGTGTTGEAAFYEGFSAVLIEREAEYRTDIARRMKLVMAGPDERRRAIVKVKAKPDDLTGTLFAEPAPMAAE